MQAADVTARVTPVETMSLLYATRAVAPGKVACIGVKNFFPPPLCRRGGQRNFWIK